MTTSQAKRRQRRRGLVSQSPPLLPIVPTQAKALAYKPFPWQEKAHKTKARFKLLWCGRRAGKSRFAIHETISAIIEAAKTPLIDNEGFDRTATLSPPVHIWTVGPTNAQLRQVWNEMKDFIPAHWIVQGRPGQMGGRNRSGWKEDDMYVWLELKDRAGRILPGVIRPQVFWELKTADNPESLQTVGLDFLHVTEAQDVKETAWNKLRPTLDSPGRLGRAIIEGIPPMSRAHWFSRRWHQANNKPSALAVAFRATTFDNVLLTKDQMDSIVEEKETTVESIWRRMYMAEQAEGGGGFFQKVHKACIGDAIPNPQPNISYVAGLDLGKQIDPTVLIIKDRRSRHSLHYLEFLKTDWQIQIAAIESECKRWGVTEVHMDSTGMGGDVLYEELAVRGLPVIPFKFTSVDKYQLFLSYATALQHETVTFPAEWTKLSDQLDSITAQQSGMGYIFRTVGGGHDDWVDAECLALRGCDPPMREGEQIVIPTRRTMRSYVETPTSSGKRGQRTPLFQRIREQRYGKAKS